MTLFSGLLRTSTLRSTALRDSVRDTLDAAYFSWDTNPVRGSAVRVFPVRGSMLFKLYDVISFKAMSRAIDTAFNVMIPGLFCRVYTKVQAIGSTKLAPFIDNVTSVASVDSRHIGLTFSSLTPFCRVHSYMNSQWASKSEVWPVMYVISSNWVLNAKYKYNGYYQLELDPNCAVFN